MKTKVAFLTFLATAVVSSVWAQSTEDDDMYFTSKDRAALNAVQSASRQEVLASASSRRITESEVASTINPTDSYSARNVNPEYISGSKVGSNSTANVQYFSPNYQPTAVNQNLASNSSNCNCNNYAYNGFNNGFNRFGNMNGMGGMSMIGMGMSPWGFNNGFGMNPYSSFNDPYGMGMMGNNFYQPGLSFGFGSGFGNSWGSPSMSFWNNYYGMNSFYGGWGNTYGYSNFYNRGFGNPYSGYYGGNAVAVVERPGRQSTRNQEIDRYYGTNGTINNSSNAGGRVASNEYYNRTWRNDIQPANSYNNGWSSRSSQSNSANNNNSWNNTNTWNNTNNNGWNNSSWNSGGSRSFSSGGGGGASGGGGGGSSGGRRGRD